MASSILGSAAHKQDSRAAAQTGHGYLTLRKLLNSISCSQTKPSLDPGSLPIAARASNSATPPGQGETANPAKKHRPRRSESQQRHRRNEFTKVDRPLVSRMYDDRVKSFSSVGHVDEETQKNAQLNKAGSRDVKI